MMVELVLKDANLVTPEGILPAWIAISSGKIAALGQGEEPPGAKRIINVGGRYVLPGLVDAHCHLASLQPFDADVLTESRGAVVGGITTMNAIVRSTRMGPADTFKPVTTPEDVVSYVDVFEKAREIVDRNSFADCTFTPHIMTDNQAAEIPDYAERLGITTFKFFGKHGAGPGWGGRIGAPIVADDGVIFSGLEQVARLGSPAVAMIHAENYEVSRVLSRRLREAGRGDLVAWDESWAGFIEAEFIRRVTYFAKLVGCPIYIVHVSSLEGLQEVARAKGEGMDVRAEVVPHHLIFTRDDARGLLIKSVPPVRDERLKEKLWEGLKDGTIDCVASDNIPIKMEHKLRLDGDVWSAGPGFSNVETLLPLLLSEGVNAGRISLTRLVEVCCRNPAKLLGIYPQKGEIRPGSDADLVIVDLGKRTRVGGRALHSCSDFSVYDGMELKGWPVFTLLRGITVAQEGDPTAEAGVGNYIFRHK